VIGQGRGRDPSQTIDDQKISSSARKFDGFKKTDFPPIWYTPTLPEGAVRYDNCYENFIEKMNPKDPSLEKAERFLDVQSKKWGFQVALFAASIPYGLGCVICIFSQLVYGSYSQVLLVLAMTYMPLVGAWAFCILRRRSQIINLFFNEETGVITLRTFNLGPKSDGNTFINISPDFSDFEMSSKIEDLIQEGSTLSDPPSSRPDKLAALSLSNEKLGNFSAKLGTVDMFLVLKDVDLSSPFGPIPAHLFWMNKNSYNGVVQKIEENQELFRESKFGAKLLDLN